MKKLFFFFSLLFSVAFAQLQNSKWVLGDGIWGNDSGNYVIDFSVSPPQFTTVMTSLPPNEQYISGHTNAMICDTSGNLMLYTEGVRLYNYLHRPVLYGDTLHAYPYLDYVDDMVNPPYPMYRLGQAAILLPTPDSNYLYNLFLISGQYHPVGFPYGGEFRHIVVDMRQDSGRGAVISKQTVYKAGVDGDFLNGCGVSACRHANGRDWWIVMRQDSDAYYLRWLLTPTGLQAYPQQPIAWNDGKPMLHMGVSTSSFSPNGAHYITAEAQGYVSVYDFDRCTGIITPHQRFRHSPIPNIWAAGLDGYIAISPNSRYLYNSAECFLFQYDLQAADIAASEQFIDSVNCHTSGPSIQSIATAYDGKIYAVSTWRPNAYFSVIHNPNVGGTGCNFVHDEFQYPCEIPDNPINTVADFRLGAAKGTACDTLGLPAHYGIVEAAEEELSSERVRVYPNPANDQLTLAYSIDKDAHIVLYDMLGRSVLSQSLLATQTQVQVSVSHLPTGIYTYALVTENGITALGKISVQH